MHLNGLSSTVKTGLAGDLEKMKAKAVEFTSSFNTLLRLEPDRAKYPEQWKKWSELKSYGENTRAAIKRITGTIDTAGNVIDSITYGVTHPFGLDPFGLGFLPMLPAAGVAVTGAVIASTIAAMTYFITSAYEYGKFADASPEVRAELTRRASSTGVQGMLGSVTGLLVVAGIIYLLPKLLKARK